MMRLLAILFSGALLTSLVACSDSHAPAVKNESSYAAIARGKIDVESGLLNITVPGDAVFTDINVTIGSTVKTGDVLAKLNSEQEKLALDMATAEINNAQIELDSLNSRVKNTEQLAQRWRSAANEGAAEQAQADEAQQNLLQLRATINTATSTLEMAKIKRKQAQYALTQRSIRAPQNADIVKINAQVGAVSGNAGSAFVLLPNKPLIIRAEVNESFIGKIHKGTKASVSFEAAPQSAQVEAHVTYIGNVLEAGHWGDEQQQTSRVIECILEFDQPQHYLVGQNVMVKFHAQH